MGTNVIYRSALAVEPWPDVTVGRSSDPRNHHTTRLGSLYGEVAAVERHAKVELRRTAAVPRSQDYAAPVPRQVQGRLFEIKYSHTHTHT